MDLKRGKTVTKSIKEEPKRKQLRRDNNKDDCVVLGFNPFKEVPKKYTLHNDKELSIISSKGLIVHREWPHWRHLCDNLPFKMISHEKYCKKCYCYVCNKTAPCMYWKTHCHAKMLRNFELQLKELERATTNYELSLKELFHYLYNKTDPCLYWKTHWHANDREQIWKMLGNLELSWKEQKRATTNCELSVKEMKIVLGKS